MLVPPLVEMAERSRGDEDGSELPRRVERKTREMVERSASGLGEEGGEIAADQEVSERQRSVIF